VFGRRHRAQVAGQPSRSGADTEIPAVSERTALGPYDVEVEPDDGWIRLDLGSLRLPVPEGAQLQVEVDSSGPVRAVHLMTGVGQITLTAFAAPRSGGLWHEVVPELVTKLRTDGAQVGSAAGEWGEEVEAVTGQGVLRFLGVDGPRWMLRGVAGGPAEDAQPRVALLRDVVRQTVVVRGSEPLPVRSPLPLRLPGPLGEQLKQATTELVNAAVEGGPSSGPDTGARD
jgi:hypothetical protein